MRLIILSVVVLSLAIDARCGVVLDLFGKIKDTTNDIKDDIKGFFSSGKDLVFGDHHHEGLKEPHNPPDCNNHEEKRGEGFVSGLFRKVHDKVDDVKHNVHNMFTGNAKYPNNVETTTKVNKVVGASNKVDFQNNKDNKNTLNNGDKPLNPNQNPINNTVVDSDENFNFDIDVRDSFPKDNETARNIKKNVEETVNNVKNTENSK